MSNFDDIFEGNAPRKGQTNQPFDKEAWAEKKQAERQAVYDLADSTAEAVSADGSKFQAYLDVQTRFSRYSATNVLLILAQKPDATQLKDFDGWKDAGASIKRQQKGISILEPGEEYEREDGSIGTSYNVKRVFDISQTTARAKAQPSVSMDDRLLLKALISRPTVPIQMVDDLPNHMGALYDHDQQVVFVRRGMDAADIFRSVSKELAHAEIAAVTKDYTREGAAFAAYSVSYMLCREYGIDASGYDFSRLPDSFRESDAQSIRAVLSEIRDTVLPIGTRKINAFRTLTTESLAVFMPFKVQEIQDKGGIYFGENAISHNLIMCNKANLLNQSAFLLGVPGSGKSFSAKELIAFLMLNTEDDILICDPEGEFAPLVEAMGSDIGTVISVAAGGKDRLNAMYMVEGYGENNPIVEKSQFIMSLVEQIDKHGVGPQHKSIIDRCTALVYQEAEETGIIPTLCTLREKLMEQPEEKAREIALSLELFTTGSLDIFGHGSNVDLDKRVVVFNIHDLGEQLKPTGLLVITDTMLNRVTLNWKRGKRTHVFIDEFHVVFENEYSGNFFNSAWRQFRKRNAYPTAITQNVEYLLDSVQASTMLSNSEFIVMLNQAASDREKLARLLNISNEQMSYVTNADAGCGLIKYGSALVPFVNRFPKDTQLYKLMTTKPGEGVFGGEGKEVTA